MKIKTISTLFASIAVLAGCQTATTYERIGYGPELEVSQARCEIDAMGVERGYMAMGSAGYVMGAAIGNAIDNEIRKHEFIKRCMVLHGWKAVPAGQTTSVSTQDTAAVSRDAAVHVARPTGQATIRASLPSGQIIAGQ